MADLERIFTLDRADLDEGNYTASLLEAAGRVGLLGEDALNHIQSGCLALLAEKASRYTGGESSSLRVETAQALMDSNLFTIGVQLKSFPPDDGVQALLDLGPQALYALGRKRIDRKLLVARQRYRTALRTMPEVKNQTYRETLVGGIRGFFKCYDPDFNAKELHITADYPLCLPVWELGGIEFIQAWLDAIICENTVCGLFPGETVHRLLFAQEGDYSFLIFNFFQSVLTAALGCALAEVPIWTLSVPRGKAVALQGRLLHLSREALGLRVDAAFLQVTQALGLEGSTWRYAQRALPAVTGTLYLAVSQLTLPRILPELPPV